MQVFRLRIGNKPFHTMTASDAVRCLTAADDASPKSRGEGWERVFLNEAARLGYKQPPGVPVCRCGCAGLLLECRLVRPEGFTERRPEDKPYRDPPGMHRHECPRCGCVWTHADFCAFLKSDDEFGSEHTCPELGCNGYTDMKCTSGERRPSMVLNPRPAHVGTVDNG